VAVASVLVVNFNGAAHLPGCLRALDRQTLPRHRFEVVVLDNASADRSADVVPARFPWVRLVRSPVNLGFAAGNNRAAEFAHGDRLILLNHDTVADPHWLTELLRVSDRFPGRLVASKLVFADRPGVANSGGLTLLRDGRGADSGFRMPDDGRFERCRPVFAGCGAALLVPRPPAGRPLFRPGHFLYYEDTELGWRTRRAGGGCVFAPRAVVLHAHGAAAGETSAAFRFYTERNRLLTTLLHGDPVAVGYGAGVLAAKVMLGRAPVRAGLSALARAPGILGDRFGFTGGG
jgi:GT2 family glycosyltransferase